MTTHTVPKSKTVVPLPAPLVEASIRAALA